MIKILVLSMLCALGMACQDQNQNQQQQNQQQQNQQQQNQPQK